MDLHLKDKAALVTGAGSGIGRAAAIALAREGARVMLADRGADNVRAAAKEITELGLEAQWVVADIADPQQAAGMVEATVAAFGGLDVAVNSAGITQKSTPIEHVEDELLRQVVDVNFVGTYYSLRAEIRAMRASGGGSIVNLTSMAAFTGTEGLSAYNATKHAVLGLTRTAALETAQQNIRVNTVAPGTIETPMIEEFASSSEDDVMAPIRAAHPMGRTGTVEEVTGAILYLASDQASFTTGAAIAVDGGYVTR